MFDFWRVTHQTTSNPTGSQAGLPLPLGVCWSLWSMWITRWRRSWRTPASLNPPRSRPSRLGEAGRPWHFFYHSESAWIHHLGQSENGVYSQNDHLMGHMMASRNGFGIPPKNQTNIIPTFQGHSCHPLPKWWFSSWNPDDVSSRWTWPCIPSGNRTEVWKTIFMAIFHSYVSLP